MTDSSQVRLYEARAEILKALAHPTRLMIMDRLAEAERCVGELHTQAGCALPTLSRHLAQMKAAGIVANRREGNQVYYRLLLPCLTRTFGCVDEALRQEARRREQAAPRPGAARADASE